MTKRAVFWLKVLVLGAVLLAVQSVFVFARLSYGGTLQYWIGYYATPALLMFGGGVWRIRTGRWTRASGCLVSFGFYGQFVGPQLRACLAS